MSERNRRRAADGGPDWASMTKAERRAAAKAAKARAAAARRRRQALLSVLAGVAVVGVIVAAFALLNRGDRDGGTGPAGTPTAGASGAGTSTAAQPAPTPQLPPGADPALASKPTVSAGQGQLTKLVVTPLVKGTGPAARPGQRLTVNYVGVTYPTGEEFDASWGRGDPFSFTLGEGGVIPGWDQGLNGVTVGSRVQVDIPADLAYGNNPTGGQPAGPLRFVVDLLAAS